MNSPRIAFAMLAAGPSRPRAGRGRFWPAAVRAVIHAWLHGTRRGSARP